jgi:hypothetical protein
MTGGMTKQGPIAADYSDSDDSGGLAESLTNSNHLDGGTETGKTIQVAHGASIDVKLGSSTVEFKTGEGGDTSLHGDGRVKLAVGEKDVDAAALAIMNEVFRDGPGDPDALPAPGYHENLLVNIDQGVNEYLMGTVAYSTQILTLNAGLVGLEHSSFGAWTLELAASGTLVGYCGTESLDGHREIYYVPISGGDSGALKAPAANGAFTTGKAMAMATDDELVKFFTGEAALTVNGAGNGGDLLLSVLNFYDIGFELAVSGSGFQAVYNSIPTITDHGNTSGITLDQSRINAAKNPASADMKHDTYLTGNFYGSGANASEATGRFNVDAHNIHVSGSFGVKQ